MKLPDCIRNLYGNNLMWSLSVHGLSCYHGNLFLQVCFQKMKNPFAKWRKFFLTSTLMFLVNISVKLLHYFSFNFDAVLKFGERQKFTRADPRWSKHPRHMTSSLLDADLKENIFGNTIYPLSVIVITLIVSQLWKGGKVPSPRLG